MEIIYSVAKVFLNLYQITTMDFKTNGMINTNSTSGTMFQGQHPITMRAAPSLAIGGAVW